MKPEERIKIASKIRRRRLQILVHSYIYYELNDNIISDSKWSEWAHELVDLQNEYPDIAKEEMYADIFEGFKGDSGSHFTYDDRIISAATRVLDISYGRYGRI